jgi:endonuclease I
MHEVLSRSRQARMPMRRPHLLLCLVPLLAHAQPPPGYYDPAQGLTGEALRSALRDIISPHTALQYSQLWGAFYRTDRKPDNTVWDIYSDVPSGTPSYIYQFVSDQCGTYNGEGDCFNREHSFPSSWFDDLPPMNSDLFHIYPTDGWVNQARGSWPYGTVAVADFTSDNGGKRGPCTWPGCTGTVFEPIDAYKGDLARGYFYMLTRYQNESASWPAPILSGGEFFGWTESLLVAWHTADPVSQKEIARNDSIYLLQGNRNPYIDAPQWAYSIWGPQASVPEESANIAGAWYADGVLTVEVANTTNAEPISVLDALGRNVLAEQAWPGRTTYALDLPAGAYCVVLGDGGTRSVMRFAR